MTDQIRTFRTARMDQPDAAPVAFQVDDQEFKVWPHKLPDLVFWDLASTSLIREQTPILWRAMRCMFDADASPEHLAEYDRFYEYVRDPAHPIEQREFAAIVDHLLEVKSGFPTPPPSD